MQILGTGQHPAHEAVERRGIALHAAVEAQSFTLGKDRDAVFGHGTRKDDMIPRPRPPSVDGHPWRDHPNARGIDENLVGRTPGHHLGIAGHQLHSRPVQSPANAGQDSLQVGHGKSLLQDEPHAQVARLGTAHGHIVDRTVDRQIPDIAAGEKNGIDHEGVGRKGQTGAGQIENGAVVERR